MNSEITQPIEVRELDAASAQRWDSFVADCPDATFFHRAGWKDAVDRSFGHATHYLYAEMDGEIRGVLPLVHIKSRIFGNSLISNAFAVYGGVAATDPRAAAALDRRALELADALDVDYLESRSPRRDHPDWDCNAELYVTFRKSIDPDPEKNLLAIPRKQRAMVRKGIKAGLTGIVDPDVDRLHPIYAASVRNLGTPVFARKFFEILKSVFGDDCEILTIEREGRPLASVMSFYFRDEVLPYYGGGVAQARASAANDFMYWEVMRRACERGCRVFDYGRSKRGTGSFAFKKHWGFDPAPLYHEFKLRRGDHLPDINPMNPKYRLFIAAWKRLPLPVANILGPHIVRNLG